MFQLRLRIGEVLDFTVVPMDDYKSVFGLTFFKKANAILVPASNVLTVLDISTKFA